MASIIIDDDGNILSDDIVNMTTQFSLDSQKKSLLSTLRKLKPGFYRNQTNGLSQGMLFRRKQKAKEFFCSLSLSDMTINNQVIPSFYDKNNKDEPLFKKIEENLKNESLNYSKFLKANELVASSSRNTSIIVDTEKEDTEFIQVRQSEGFEEENRNHDNTLICDYHNASQVCNTSIIVDTEVEDTEFIQVRQSEGLEEENRNHDNTTIFHFGYVERADQTNCDYQSASGSMKPTNSNNNNGNLNETERWEICGGSNDEYFNGNYSTNSIQQSSKSMSEKLYTTENTLFLSIDTCNLTTNNSETLVSKIESLILWMLKKIVNDEELKFVVKNKCDKSNLSYTKDMVSMKAATDCSTKTINFHSKKSGHHFSVILFLLSEIYKLLQYGGKATKREIYYLKNNFLKNQICLNNALQDICFLLESDPWDLAIHSQAKGIMAGCIKIKTKNGDSIDYKGFSSGLVLPTRITDITTIETTAKFVLIVEKDTIFHRLLDDRIFDTIQIDFILITAKGYPDINSRWLLKKIWDEYFLPIFILVDADPHGIEIMCTYKYGSMSMAQHSNSLAVPTIKWIGIFPSEIEALCLNVLPMTTEDYRKIKSMLKRPYICENIKTELQILSNLDQKCEIESLYSVSPNFLIQIFLTNKILLFLDQH